MVFSNIFTLIEYQNRHYFLEISKVPDAFKRILSVVAFAVTILAFANSHRRLGFRHRQYRSSQYQAPKSSARKKMSISTIAIFVRLVIGPRGPS